ncbi:MAG: hypothetical protein HYX77_02070 [Acidobacteria bacterium]|nr:hypothetical protein [Acidobacteriota bacterium]
MLRWFRIHASRIAITAIVSLAAVGVSSISPHEDDCHDAACWAVAVEHDAAAHRFDAPPAGTGAHPLHCLVCHWVRSFRPRTEAKSLLTPAAEAGTVVPVELFTAAAAAPAAQPPLRSPPSSPLEA